MAKLPNGSTDGQQPIGLPARSKQIKQLASLFGDPSHLTAPALCLYGHSSCGKSLVLDHVFNELQAPYVVINCVECYTNSLVFREVLQGLDEGGAVANRKCDTMNDFVRNLKGILVKKNLQETVFIVFDKAERLRDREINFLPALVNLQELTGSNLCVIFVSELPWEKFHNGVGMRQPLAIFFPDYTKDELVEILCYWRPAEADLEFYQQYVSMVLAVFSVACRDLRELMHLAELNYKIYCEPIRQGEATAGEKRKLWRNVEPHLRDALQQLYMRKLSSEQWERLHAADDEVTSSDDVKSMTQQGQMIELPFYSKYLLIAAYLASYNPVKTDRRFFVKNAGRMRKTARTMKKDERKNCHLRGPRAFPLDRLMAIFYSIVDGRVPPSANLFSQITSLVSLHLMTQISPDDQIDSARYKCAVSLDFIVAISKTVSFDVVKYLYDFI